MGFFDDAVGTVSNTVGTAWQGYKDVIETGYDLQTLQWGRAANKSGQIINNLGQATGLIKKPDNQAPGAPPTPPALTNANMIGLQSQLSQQQKMRSASTILTGGGGLLDEPTTASRVLLGS